MKKAIAAILGLSLTAMFGCAHADRRFVAPAPAACEPSGPAGRIRIASYNIKAALASSLDEIGAAIAEMNPDVIALQEVDRLVARSGRADEARVLAERLGYAYAFAA